MLYNKINKKLLLTLIPLFFYNFICQALPIIHKNNSPFFNENDKTQGLQVDTIYTMEVENMPESVLPRNFINFVGFNGQGVIYIKAFNIESFKLYLNGNKIETLKICKMGEAKIDVSQDLKNGRNILSLSRIKYIGDDPEKSYIKIKIPYPTLIKGSSSDSNKQGLKILETFIEEEIKQGFPGCQLFIAKDGKIIKNASYGYLSTTDKSGKLLPIRKRTKSKTTTLYDIASNTKIYSLTFAIQKLVYEKKLSLDDKVTSFFPSFKDEKKAKIKGKNDITIKDLLLHQAGFPAGYPFISNKRMKEKDENVTNKEVTLEILMNIPLSYEPRTDWAYSDVDYILLCFIVEKITKMPLDEYVKKEIYQPLSLKYITYKPLQNGFKKTDCAATEINSAIRSIKNESYSKKERGLLQGIVHDGNAYFPMNQVSGHAGLFSNAESLGVLAQVILNGGGYGNTKIFDEEVTDLFAGTQGLYQTQALGWRKQGANYYYSWAFSRFADREAIGHTGWTGSLTIIDRRENLIIILLTNAKNTSLVTTEEAKGKFEGDFYLLKNYCIVPNFVYASINDYSSESIDNMLLELFEQRCTLHKKDSFYQNDAFINDLYAILNTIKKLSSYSRTLKEFNKSEEMQQIKDYMEGVTQGR